jgi:hypothetical protein
MQGAAAVLVDRTNLRAFVKQKLDYVAMAASSGVMQRGPAIVIVRIHLCSFGDEHLHDIPAALHSRYVQRCPAVPILSTHIRSLSKQQPNYILVAFRDLLRAGGRVLPTAPTRVGPVEHLKKWANFLTVCVRIIPSGENSKIRA